MLMREIMFRGKALEDGYNFKAGEFVYGSLVFEGDAPYIVGPVIEANEDYIAHEWWVPVDPTTVGQCTGLKDMHGVKLYEGDIMGFHAYGYYYIGVVQYSNAGAAFGVKCKTASETETCPYLDVVINNHRAVKIGNIHDNPELLKT